MPFHKIIALQPIIPINHPAFRSYNTDQHSSEQYKPQIHYSVANLSLETSKESSISSQLENSVREIVENRVKVSRNYDKNDTTKNFLKALQQLNWIQNHLKKVTQNNENGTKLDETIIHSNTKNNENQHLKFLNKIDFHAQPIRIEETFEHASNAQQAAEKKNKAIFLF